MRARPVKLRGSLAKMRSAASTRMSGRRHIVNRWSKLAEQYEVDLVVCVAAALRRGIKDELLAPGFRISGLGQLVEAGIQGDRLVVFGD